MSLFTSRKINIGKSISLIIDVIAKNIRIPSSFVIKDMFPEDIQNIIRVFKTLADADFCTILH